MTGDEFIETLKSWMESELCSLTAEMSDEQQAEVIAHNERVLANTFWFIVLADSTNVHAWEWKEHELYVQFKSGTVYQYHEVPIQVAFDWLEADSHGTFFNLRVKEAKYKYERI